MTTQDIKHLFHVNDLRLMPEAIMSVITGDKEHRDEVYKELLSINGHISRNKFDFKTENIVEQ